VKADQENFVKMVFQALGEWWTSLGAAAWLVAGVLLVIGLLALVFLLRWVFRGGLSRRMGLGLSDQPPGAEPPSSDDS
jgi:hypothetical protein